MPLKKTITIAQTGAPASVHVVSAVTINYAGNSTSAQVSSYYNDAALTGKLAALASSSLSIEGIPPTDQTPIDFVESELVKAAPQGAAPVTALEQYGSNRYAFAGAEIVKE